MSVNLKKDLNFMRYFKNTSWLFLEKIIRMIVGLFVGIWIARYLGPEQFGLFSYAQSIVGIFAVVATFGLDNLIVREIVKDKNKVYELIGTAFILKIIGSIGVLFILGIAINLMQLGGIKSSLVFIIASATVFQSFNIIDSYFQSKVLSKYIAHINIFTLLISSILKIILILNNAPLIAFAWVILFDSMIVALGYIYVFLKRPELHFNKITYKTSVAISLMKDSWSLILSGIAISFYMRADQIIIGNILNQESVGYYSAAARWTDVWFFIAISINNSLFPAIINSKNTSDKIYKDRVLNLYRLIFFLALIIASFLYILSDHIIALTYGEEYVRSADLLQLYAWSIIFVFLNNSSWKWYIAENIQHIATIRLIFGGGLNIYLNFIWIDLYGLEGAVYATLVSYSVATYFGNLIHKKTRANFKMQTKAIFSFYKIFHFLKKL